MRRREHSIIRNRSVAYAEQVDIAVEKMRIAFLVGNVDHARRILDQSFDTLATVDEPPKPSDHTYDVFDVRTANALQEHWGITLMEQLAQLTPSQIAKTPRLGQKSLDEIKAAVIKWRDQ